MGINPGRVQLRLISALRGEKSVNSELNKYGVRLLDGETLELMFDSKRGKVDRVKRMGQGLVLTNHRLIYLEGRKRARASLLSDVRYLEIVHKKRALGFLILGVLLFVGAGVLVVAGGGGLSLDPEDISLHSLAGSALGLFGLFALAAYWWSSSTQLATEIGSGEGSAISVTLNRSAKTEAEEFCTAFFERKLNSEPENTTPALSQA